MSNIVLTCLALLYDVRSLTGPVKLVLAIWHSSLDIQKCPNRFIASPAQSTVHLKRRIQVIRTPADYGNTRFCIVATVEQFGFECSLLVSLPYAFTLTLHQNICFEIGHQDFYFEFNCSFIDRIINSFKVLHFNVLHPRLLSGPSQNAYFFPFKAISRTAMRTELKLFIFFLMFSMFVCSKALIMDVKQCGKQQLLLQHDNPSVIYWPGDLCFSSLLGGQVNEVRAFGCEDDKQPCRIRRGSTPRLEVDFVSPFQARFVRTDVRGKLEGTERLPVYIPWAGLHRNACDGHGLACPLKRNGQYTYHYEMPVAASTPTFKTEYTWRLSNAWGFTIACFSMPLEVF